MVPTQRPLEPLAGFQPEAPRTLGRVPTQRGGCECVCVCVCDKDGKGECVGGGCRGVCVCDKDVKGECVVSKCVCVCVGVIRELMGLLCECLYYLVNMRL